MGVRVFVFNAVSSAFHILDGLGTEKIEEFWVAGSEIYLKKIGWVLNKTTVHFSPAHSYV